MLRSHGVVGKFVEFFGAGWINCPWPIAPLSPIWRRNMAPPVASSLWTRRPCLSEAQWPRCAYHCPVEAYCRAQGMWRDEHYSHPEFSATLKLDMSTVEASVAGPKRPQDRVAVTQLREATDQFIELNGKSAQLDTPFPLEHSDQPMHHGDVAIAAITSCTNTSNPAVMIGAGLVAQKALARGLKRKPWVKSSLAPGSKVVTDYLTKAGLQQALDEQGFNLVGYGCTTCIGNSGPLPEPWRRTLPITILWLAAFCRAIAILKVASTPWYRPIGLASPPLVVAYALAGTHPH